MEKHLRPMGTTDQSNYLQFSCLSAVRWEYTSPMLDMNCTVCNCENEILHALAEHENKEVALGMEAIVEDYVDIDELDLTAGLFWEMTYYPFDYKEKKEGGCICQSIEIC